MIAYTSKMTARNASHSNCSCPGELERLAFEKDGIRAEDAATAAKLEVLIETHYVRLGYAPVWVPVMPVNRRAEFILACLGEA